MPEPHQFLPRPGSVHELCRAPPIDANLGIHPKPGVRKPLTSCLLGHAPHLFCFELCIQVRHECKTINPVTVQYAQDAAVHGNDDASCLPWFGKRSLWHGIAEASRDVADVGPPGNSSLASGMSGPDLCARSVLKRDRRHLSDRLQLQST